MSLETTLTALLRQCCPRVYVGAARDVVTRPYVVWARIGGQALAYMEGALVATRNADVQVEVYADRQDEADAIAQEIERVLVETDAFSAEALGESTTVPPDTTLSLYGTQQDYTIWAPR